MELEDILAHPATVLSQEQRRFYYDQGYLAFPSLIGEALLAPLRAALAKVVDSTRPLTSSTERFDLEPGHSVESPRLRRAAYLDDIDPLFWDLCIDSVIPDIAADLLGPNVRFREIMMNFKWAGGGAEVKWHQDMAFYPHTHSGTQQFLLYLEDVTPEQGPLQVIPESHKGRIYEHYDADGVWTGAISEADMTRAVRDRAITLMGPAGTVSVHHSRTIHGSARNMSGSGRPAFVLTYSAADAMPYTAPAYPSSRYGRLVRGSEPRFAHHEALHVPLPPDWSNGYTSIFAHQQGEDSQTASG